MTTMTTAAGAFAPSTPSVPGQSWGSGYVEGWEAPAYRAARTNVLAIFAIACSAAGFAIVPFLGSIAGVILGHIGRSQIRKTGQGGGELALWGIILGYAGIVLSIAVTVVMIVAFAQMVQAFESTV